MSAKDKSGSKQYGKLRPSEIVLSIIAGLMLLGWAFRWMGYGGPPEAAAEAASEAFPWFAVFSVPSAILVLVLIFLKLNCLEFLPGNGQEKILPYISLLPVLGFLIAELGSVQTFLTVGGAMALAYISATSYWRNYIPDFITNPLGDDSADDDAPAAPKKTAPAAGAAKETKKDDTRKDDSVGQATEETQGETAPADDHGKEKGAATDDKAGS